MDTIREAMPWLTDDQDPRLEALAFLAAHQVSTETGAPAAMADSLEGARDGDADTAAVLADWMLEQGDRWGLSGMRAVTRSMDALAHALARALAPALETAVAELAEALSQGERIAPPVVLDREPEHRAPPIGRSLMRRLDRGRRSRG